MITRRFGYLGTVAAVIIGSGCAASATDSNSTDYGQLEDALGEDVTCGGLHTTSSVEHPTWNKTTGLLNIYSGTQGTLIITPGNSVVKVNGRLCKDPTGATIPLASVKAMNIIGHAGAETFVLDFSLALPTADLAKAVTTSAVTLATGVTVTAPAAGILVDGGESAGTAEDTVIVKTTKNNDFVTVAQASIAAGTDSGLGKLSVSLATAASKTPVVNLLMTNLVNKATAAKQPNLTFSLGAGDDNFNAQGLGVGGTAVIGSGVALTSPVSVYGGAGNDTVTGGQGDDKLYGGPGNDTFVSAAADGADYIDGGGNAIDLVDYSGRSTPVYVDLDSTTMTYWGADLRGVNITATHTVKLAVDASGDKTVTFATAATTPAAIVEALNAGLGLVAELKDVAAAKLVGPRLALAITGSKVKCTDVAASTATCAGLGLATTEIDFTAKNNGLGNDGSWGTTTATIEGDDIQGVSRVYGGSGNDILVGNGANNGRFTEDGDGAITYNGGIQILLDGKAGTNLLSAGQLPSTLAAKNLAVLADDTNATACPLSSSNQPLTSSLVGGTGDDWFDMTSAIGCPFSVVGGTGYNIVDYSQRAAGKALSVTLALATRSGQVNDIGAVVENDLIDATVNVVLGGAGDDTIVGSANADYLFGGAGDDIIKGGLGDDHIWGGEGDDFLNGEAGNDTFYELTKYQIGATAASEAAAVVAPNDPLSAWAKSSASDSYKKYSLGYALWGSTASAGAGNDHVNGGGSSDDGSSDKLDLSDATAEVKIVLCRDTSTTGKLTVAAPAAGTACEFTGLSDDGSGGSAANNYINVEYVAGSGTQKNTIIGTLNSETFEGGAEVDVILGQGGADYILGYKDSATITTENDILCGGDGDDTIQGGTGTKIEGEGQVTITATADGYAAAVTGAGDCYGTGLTSSADPSGVNICLGGSSVNGSTPVSCLQ